VLLDSRAAGSNAVAAPQKRGNPVAKTQKGDEV